MRDRIILFACDTPDPHPASVAFASRLARRSAARLVFHCVLPIDADGSDAGLNACVTLMDGGARQRFFDLRPDHPSVPWLHHFEIGMPERRIPRLQAALGAEIVVVEEDGRSWVDRLLGTSLAERLRGRLTCPIAVVSRAARATRVPPRTPRRRVRLHPIEAADMLNTSVDARLRAVTGWLDARAASVAALAGSATVNAAITARAQRGEGPWPERTAAHRFDRCLRYTLDEHRAAWGALGWQIRRPDRPVVGQKLELTRSAARHDFVRRVHHAGASSSLPVIPQDDPHALLIVSGARLACAPDAMLLFWFDARDDFLRILGQPGPEPSFETYAFDGAGLMLSNSRFPDHLHQRGLLPTGDVQTPLRLRVCEPGVAPREEWPLTRMAAEAVCSRDGADLRGYLDYRGTEVVGAWRWVDRYGFGMTAEVDKAALRVSA